MLLFGMPGGTEWMVIFLFLLGLPIAIILILLSRRKAMNKQVQRQQLQTHVNINNFSITAELEKLNDLKEKGVITQEEFDAQKKKILNTP